MPPSGTIEASTPVTDLEDQASRRSAATALGIVLRGGGVKGLALLGAVAELERALRITPGAYGGTSAGGILAIALAAGYTADQLIPILRNQSFLDFLDADWHPDNYIQPWESAALESKRSFLPLLLAGVLRLTIGCIGIRTRGGMFSSEPLGRWLLHLLRWRPRAGVLPPEPDILVDTRLGALPRAALTVASSTGAQNCVIHSSVGTPDLDACLAARCTMSIPGVFHPIPSGADLLMDGGLVANFPFEQFAATWPSIRALGVFLCDGDSIGKMRDWTPSPIGVVRASLAIFLGQDELRIATERRESVVWVDINPIQTLDFDLNNEDKEFLLECGRVAALRWLRENAKDPAVDPGAVPTDDAFTTRAEQLRAMRLAARERWRARHRNRRAVLAMAALLPVLLLLSMFAAGGFALSRLHHASRSVRGGAGPTDRRVLNIAVVLNGDAEYTGTAERTFRETLRSELQRTTYVARIEVAVGHPEANSDDDNRRIFATLLNRFDSPPDYLVTIGTQVSVFAKNNYLGRIPLIFVAVTDPVDAGLVKGFTPDLGRGNIGGVAYGDIVGGVKLLQRSFPNARIGFYYSSQIPQDRRVAEMLAICCPEISRIDDSSGSPTEVELRHIDLLFGWYSFSRNFLNVRRIFSGAMVAGNEADMTRGAVAMLANNDADAGVRAAKEVLIPTLLADKTLASEPILKVGSHRFAINRTVARRHGLAIAHTLPAGTVIYD